MRQCVRVTVEVSTLGVPGAKEGLPDSAEGGGVGWGGPGKEILLGDYTISSHRIWEYEVM